MAKGGRKRSQRVKSKVDYNKLNSPSQSREECDVVEDFHAASCDDEKKEDTHGDESPNEEEVLALSEEVKMAEERLKKKEEVRRLKKRKEDVNLALKKLDKKKEKVNATSLRRMKSVMKEVDGLMDKKLKFADSSSSESSSTSSDSASSSSGESESSEEDSEDSEDQSSEEEDRRKKKGSKKKKKGGKKKSKSKSSKKSGKTKKITSKVKHPQDWPHSFLRLHFVDKNKTYDQLSMSEFCAGYCTIMEGIKGKKLLYRLTHLKDLMYLATRHHWKSILNFHASCLLEIERGQLKWGETTKFQLLQSTTLVGGTSNPRANGGGGGSAAAASTSSTSTTARSPATGAGGFVEGPVLFCKEYQRGICTRTSDHDALDRYGVMRRFRHICAKCWLSARNKLPHPETDETCPSRSL